MTEMRIDIECLELRGLPTSYRETLPPLLEQHLDALARGGTPESAAGGGVAIVADRVAREVWHSVQHSMRPPMAGTGGAT
ncbi:hypothetical protein [Mycolicibacterium psychrotolerans]|uniref:Uncharacterized protein n=1 Tax=Mycolicibacterium psychrotolerans TaxID=216929 RepID=A0A7I7MDP2_9MYCO|nr:hypothetical protein [Mycolicibacterium psychrotolerans]BBX69952.1 hypothetical protein MPSYJ_34130 [Mycolicibacterium psychrotolerans]